MSGLAVLRSFHQPRAPANWRLAAAVLAARLSHRSIVRLGMGAGSTWPGRIALAIYPSLIVDLAAHVKHGVILVAGTNGKTTTSLLLRKMIQASGLVAVHNETGANLESGLAGALVDYASLDGCLDVDYAILEVDENALPRVIDQVSPRIVIGLNLFRDQLDRYGEVNTIARNWASAFERLPADTTLVLNGDDPALAFIGQQTGRKAIYFGLDEPERLTQDQPHAVDSIYCPRCGARLAYSGYYLSHLGDYSCPACGFRRSPPALASKEWPQALIGLYNKYNTLAAVLAARAAGIEESVIRGTIAEFHPAFGRAEELDVSGRRVRILLSKNPAGMNETIRLLESEFLSGHSRVALLVLNDRIPDGTDVSWIWDADTERLFQPGVTLVAGGERAYDMALRLEYSPANHGPRVDLIVKQDLNEAISAALECTQPGEILHVIPTYSAMLQVRQALLGHAIL